MFFTEKALIRPEVEQMGSSVLSKIKSLIRINLAIPLKTGLFHGRNTFYVWNGGGRGEERHFCLKTRLRTFLEIKFFCVTVWLHSAPNKREDHFLRICSKILRGGWGEG